MESENFSVTTKRRDIARSHLERLGMRGPFRFIRLPGGTNNQVFLVEGNGSKVVLKMYFKRESDPRDRLGVEYSFLQFAVDLGVDSVPQPLGFDSQSAFGIYEYIEGRHIATEDIRPELMEQALRFVKKLEAGKKTAQAQQLGFASEACFSFLDYQRANENRLCALSEIDDSTESHKNALKFVRCQLIPFWNEMLGYVTDKAKSSGLSWEESVSFENRSLSPSDFGFHNALLTKEGRVVFLDFEYAGWDDPIKMVSDFFSQHQVETPLDYFPKFVSAMVSRMRYPELQYKRAFLVLPLVQVKWCCILLNHFLPVGQERRFFANSSQSGERHKHQQLAKAKKALQKLESEILHSSQP